MITHKPVNPVRGALPPDSADALLRVSDLTLRYESGPALDAVSFALARGEQVGLVGPNGAGKSTLFKVIAGLLTPDSGRIQRLDGASAARLTIAYIPQRSHVDWHFPATVADVVLMGRTGKLGLFRRPGPRDREVVQHALELVNLSGLERRQIGQLSGGQQQRMFLARALAQEADLMLLDEPLTGLDANAQEDIFRVLARLRERQVTVLFALHDLKVAAQRFERVMLLNRRLIGFGLPDDVFTPQRLMAAYGSHLHLTLTEEGVLAVGDTCCDHGEERYG